MRKKYLGGRTREAQSNNRLQERETDPGVTRPEGQFARVRAARCEV